MSWPSPSFPVNFNEICERLDNIDPIQYGKSRNYFNGKVTHLSPYISRGIISTRKILDNLLNRDFDPKRIEKLIQELTWRDYWQQVWINQPEKVDPITTPNDQPIITGHIPKAILEAQTGIEVIDRSISKLYQHGYMHNHARMYIASIVCNISKCHWKFPAQWMYHHLLDGDWASNALSWQWVAGVISKKKYFANQTNINRYGGSNQTGTLLDCDYDSIKNIKAPHQFSSNALLTLNTVLPHQKKLTVNKHKKTYIYNSYNLDPVWNHNEPANRILLLEPSHFKKYPISKQSLHFIHDLALKNIEGIQLFIGEFSDCVEQYELSNISFKEHPLNRHYKGNEHERDWMFNARGNYPSFFSYWKDCKKELNL